MRPSGYKFGWRRDLPDHRDLYFDAPVAGVLPPSVDLRSHMPAVYDQGKLGSCTANAIAAHLDFNRKKQAESFMHPSRLFIYYNERLVEGTVESDAGASIRDSVKVVVKYGACHERKWPYSIDLFAVEPNKFCYDEAVNYQALKYYRLRQSELAFKTCLAQGYPFVVGITVYSSFMNVSGNVPLPAPSDDLEGGHAIVIVGYDTSGNWIFRNSWGSAWGHKGYGYLPKEYLLNPDLSSDSWTLRQVE